MASVSNGNGEKTKLEIERLDLLKVGGFVLLLLSVVCGAALFVFQTQAQAIVEHAAMDQRAALHEQKVTMQREFDEKEAAAVVTDVEDVKSIVLTLDANQRVLMKRIGTPKRMIERLPAGVSFEEMGIEDPE